MRTTAILRMRPTQALSYPVPVSSFDQVSQTDANKFAEG